MTFKASSRPRPRPRPEHDEDPQSRERTRQAARGADGYDAQQAALSPHPQPEDSDDPYTVPRGQLTFDNEGLENPPSGAYHSRILHCPGAWSGVTIGRGYDMKHRTADEVKADLRAAGVDASTAAKMSQGAGLSGKEAARFCKGNSGLEISPEEQKNLFDVVYMEKYAYAKKLLKKWTGTDLDAAHELMRDVLVDLFYRGDMTRSKWEAHDFARITAESDWSGMLGLLNNRELWGNIDTNRYLARVAYLRGQVAE